MTYVISGLSAEPYQHLYGLSEKSLSAYGAIRYIADQSPGFPDRIEMRDAQKGEALLLVNHMSLDSETPYKASHAIFILEGAHHTYKGVNEIPDVLYRRLISLRGFNSEGMIIDADVAKGDDIARTIERLFENDQIAFIHAHNAAQGCYAGRIDRY